MSDVATLLTILGVVVVLFVWNRLPVEIVAIGAALALVATDILTVEQSLAGFGDTTVIFIASLFVVSEAIDSTGITTWAGQQLVRRAGGGPRQLLIAVMLMVALLTALISVNGAVAALLPMAVVTAMRLGMPTSQLLMPLAFAAHAGSMLALTGTPINVLVSDAADEAGAGTFGFFEFTLVGVPLLLGTLVITILIGPKVLPVRRPATLGADLSAHARTLGRQYLSDRAVARLRVPSTSLVVGRRVVDLLDRLPDGVAFVRREAADGVDHRTDPSATVGVGDVVVLRGPRDEIDGIMRVAGLAEEADPIVPLGDGNALDQVIGVAELVVPPRSAIVGARVYPGQVTDSGDLVIVAVQRGGSDLGPRESVLEPGDVLLVQGRWEDLEREVDADPNVIPVDDPRSVRRQAVALGPKSTEALIVVAGMVVALATGIVTPAIAGLVAAVAMVLLGVLTPRQAYRGISWTTVVLVGAMIPISTAMRETGAAEDIAEALLDVVDSPTGLLFGLFLITAVFGQLISNTATALIVIPIGISAAAELDISPAPVMMTITVSAAAALLTPVATPANLMVMEPGGYRFGDYWKLGLPLLALYGVLAVLYVPLIWGF
ncbi:MAG: SLC13 family permease [Ilumatobacteraceae bacterium]|nr:SLC13 family permease [Ilumatobacteraceae bacterium]